MTSPLSIGLATLLGAGIGVYQGLTMNISCKYPIEIDYTSQILIKSSIVLIFALAILAFWYAFDIRVYGKMETVKLPILFLGSMLSIFGLVMGFRLYQKQSSETAMDYAPPGTAFAVIKN